MPMIRVPMMRIAEVGLGPVAKAGAVRARWMGRQLRTMAMRARVIQMGLPRAMVSSRSRRSVRWPALAAGPLTKSIWREVVEDVHVPEPEGCGC